ncbi:MAG: hypothetical protein ACRDCE_20450 [Cetobacterium sp.]|uniref:hypothetical protein n=1 Tax=Cetobacterium sp. TaxID=2071632 RepID=UPI003EE7755A
MNYLVALIVITLRVFFEVVMTIAGIVWFILCAAGGLIVIIATILVYAFTKKPSL